jgi:Rrf2 family protein
VRVSAKTEYACLAMLELAARFGSGEPVRIRTIADEHGIPSRFLVQILLQLKGAGFVSSTRGAAGGYQLVKPPQTISLGEVMSVIEGQENAAPGNATGTRTPTTRVLAEAWRQIAKTERDMLNAISFGELVQKIKRSSENMYYI